VRLEPNVAAWLADHVNKTPIQPEAFAKKWKCLRRQAGFDLSQWVADWPRHTALTFHALIHGEVETSNWARTTISKLNHNYRGLVENKADAQTFWSLTPANVDADVKAS
jgi:hypothetical protein